MPDRMASPVQCSPLRPKEPSPWQLRAGCWPSRTGRPRVELQSVKKFRGRSHKLFCAQRQSFTPYPQLFYRACRGVHNAPPSINHPVSPAVESACGSHATNPSDILLTLDLIYKKSPLIAGVLSPQNSRVPHSVDSVPALPTPDPGLNPTPQGNP